MAERNQHVAEFLRKVERIFNPQYPDTFWACEGAFRDLLKAGFLTEVLNEELRRITQDPRYQGEWLANELLLHRGGGCALSISLFETSRRYIHALPYHAMYAPVGSVELKTVVYRLPEHYRNDIFDPALRLTFDKAVITPPCGVALLRGGTYAHDLVMAGATPVLKFMTTAIFPMEWLFTRDGLQPWQANDADLSFTQLRVAADVLGKFAHQSSLQPLKKLTGHSHHSVRWAAIQNLGRLSRSEAVTKLREALGDPHPHVRRAAQRTMDKLKGRESE